MYKGRRSKKLNEDSPYFLPSGAKRGGNIQEGEKRALNYDYNRGALGWAVPSNKSKPKTKEIEPQCTECESRAIDFDDIRDEFICLDCGLVLSGPPAYVAGLIRIDYPWGNLYYTEFELEDERGHPVNAFYGNGMPRLPFNLME